MAGTSSWCIKQPPGYAGVLASCLGGSRLINIPPQRATEEHLNVTEKSVYRSVYM